ncbi:MAG: hypothetical protein Hals2KO_21510 [Halioglobus sp.]
MLPMLMIKSDPKEQAVELDGLQPETVLAILITYLVFTNHGYEFCLTSVKDGVHGNKSLHRFGYAFDSQTHHIPLDTSKMIETTVRQCLGREYDVVLKETHLHVEFDPER